MRKRIKIEDTKHGAKIMFFKWRIGNLTPFELGAALHQNNLLCAFFALEALNNGLFQQFVTALEAGLIENYPTTSIQG